MPPTDRRAARPCIPARAPWPICRVCKARRIRCTRWLRHGRKALLDVNDLGRGILNAQEALSSYYIIGYYTTNSALDGKFRRVKIALKEITSAKLDYRQGYFGGKEFNKFTAADKERQLEEALMLGDPITD